jgi:ABC-type phosphate/phosphonate transport system substrate-binding protein
MTAHSFDWAHIGKATGALAALPMYDFPELQPATDGLWAAIRDRLQTTGVAWAPPTLTRSGELEALWTDPRLLLTQTCGYPLMTKLRGRVRLVATPHYKARGCDGPFHRAAVIVRKTDPAQNLADLRKTRLALNAPDSNTGMNLLRAEIAPIAGGSSFFSNVILTGSHADSVVAVANGVADTASIDGVTWALMQRLRSKLTDQLRVLAWTSQSPGLPLITGRLTDLAIFQAMRTALEDVVHDSALASVRNELLIVSFHPLSEAYYHGLMYFEQMAIDQGYPALK